MLNNWLEWVESIGGRASFLKLKQINIWKVATFQSRLSSLLSRIYRLFTDSPSVVCITIWRHLGKAYFPPELETRVWRRKKINKSVAVIIAHGRRTCWDWIHFACSVSLPNGNEGNYIFSFPPKTLNRLRLFFIFFAVWYHFMLVINAAEGEKEKRVSANGKRKNSLCPCPTS